MANKKAITDSDMSMKIIIVAAIVLAFVGGYFVARAKYKPQIKELTKMVTDKDQAMQKMKSDSNKVVMKDDAMWIVENGMVREMDADIMMQNGSKVMTNGKIVTSDGQDTMMQNGDAMDMEGRMIEDGGDIDTTGVLEY